MADPAPQDYIDKNFPFADSFPQSYDNPDRLSPKKALGNAFLQEKGLQPKPDALPATSTPTSGPQSPQSTGNFQSGAGLPPMPQLQNMPQAPQAAFADSMRVFQDPGIILAGLGSLLTRHPMTTAFNSAAEAMDGFRKGQMDVAKQKQEEFKQKFQEAVAQNNVELERYHEIMDRKGEDAKAKFAKLYAASVGFNDPVMQSAVQSQNWDVAEKIILGREQAKQHAMAAGASFGGPEAITSIAGAIEKGIQPPVLTGLYRMAAPLRAQLAQDGFDLSKAQVQWQAAQKRVQALSGPQMTRLFGLAKSVTNTLDDVERLSQQMQLSGMTGLNYLELQSLIKTRGNSPQGQLATQYVTAVGILKEEFANLAQGGYAPTESAWQLAEQQVNGNYGVDQLAAGLDELKRLINYRVTALTEMGGTANPQNPNPYLGQTGGAPGMLQPPGGERRKQFKQGWGVWDPQTGDYVPEEAQ